MDASAVVDEATRRSNVVWVCLDGAPARAVWHVWHDGCAYLVTGGREQELPGAAAARQAVVVVRSRERRSGVVVEWTAEVEHVVPGTGDWDDVVPVLHAARLNAPDGDEQPARWARESTVLRLRPTGRERRPGG
jgi:hypothetical protein